MAMDESFFTDDAPEVNTGELSQITALVEQQLLLESKIILIEADLVETSRKLQDIKERALPDAMAACGLAEFVLLSGQKIKIKDDIFASVRADFKTEAMQWIEEKGWGDVIKDQVTIALGKGEYEKAGKILLMAEREGLSASENRSIHASTLKSLIKEQMALGVTFPEEYFSVFSKRSAVIETPKVKKASTKEPKIPAVKVSPVLAPSVPLDFNEF
jgi:hypothetical protein